MRDARDLIVSNDLPCAYEKGRALEGGRPPSVQAEADHTAEEFARFVRKHWGVESYHGKRDTAYLEDKTGRRGNPQLQTMMMLARTVGLREASRHPDMTTSEGQSYLFVSTRKAVRLSTKRGML